MRFVPDWHKYDMNKYDMKNDSCFSIWKGDFRDILKQSSKQDDGQWIKSERSAEKEYAQATSQQQTLEVSDVN